MRSSGEAEYGLRALPRGTPPPFAPGFVETERRRTSTYELIRYRAARPQPVSLVGLAVARLDDTPFVALLQR